MVTDAGFVDDLDLSAQRLVALLDDAGVLCERNDLVGVAHRGEGGWQDYWRALRANGVAVVDTWDIAYYERFSGSGGGDRPMVVSYASSPPAEVVLSDPPRAEAATGVAAETCFHQVEYAGVLRGTTHPDAARRLVEFLVGERFQRELPLTMFVSPVNPAVTLPDVFTRFGVTPANPFTLDPALIEANRATWQDQWTATQRLPSHVRIDLELGERKLAPIVVALRLGEEAGCYESMFQRQCVPRR